MTTLARMSRVFVITGASSGIGAATARRAVEAGIESCSPPSKDKLDGLVEELGGGSTRWRSRPT